MTDKQPTNEDIRKWLDDVKFHRNSPTSKYLRILLDRLESAERRDVVTPEYLQSWIDRAYEAESRIKELDKTLEPNAADLDTVTVACECKNEFKMPRDALFALHDLYCGRCSAAGKMRVKQ